MASPLVADAPTEHLFGKDAPIGNNSCIVPAAADGIWDEPDEFTRERLLHLHKEIDWFRHARRLPTFSIADRKMKNVLVRLDANSAIGLADFGLNSPFEVEFSVTAPAKGVTEIKIGSHVIHAPKYSSVHHPLMQMLLFAHKRFEDTFACTASMVPKNIFDMAMRLCSSASPNVCEASWISAKQPKSEADTAGKISEFSTAESIGSMNNPDSCIPGRGIKAAEAKTSAAWTVATAAPHHATGNRALLSGFVAEHDDQFVHAVDGVPMPVVARGAVVTDAVVLPDVWFVPGLKANMVSVSQLSEMDYSVRFGCGECSIRSASGGKTVGKAHLREGGQYVLDFLRVPLAL